MRIIGATLLIFVLRCIESYFCRIVEQNARDKLYTMMMNRIPHAPVNLYFDVTPVSRIMKHFGEDLHAFDHGFLGIIYETLECSLRVFYAFYCVATVVPMLLLSLPVVLYMRIKNQARHKK